MKYFVDGYIPSLKMVYEFQCGLYRGCERCFEIRDTRRDTKHVRNEDCTLAELFRATKEKNRLLRAEGYTVVEIWECESGTKL